jgi:hypothetical protein
LLLFIIQGEASPLEGSTHPWVKCHLEVRRMPSIYSGRRLGRVEVLPLFLGAQPASPQHCSVQGKVPEAVEVKTRKKPDPRVLN